MICQYCSKTFDKAKNSLKNHEARCSNNPFRSLQKCTDPDKLKALRKVQSENAKAWYSKIENREKFSQAMRQAVLNHPESYSDKNIVGRSKHFTVEGVRYNSTWEYIVAQLLDEQGIKWQRSKIKPISYQWNDKWHLYFPDFLLNDLDVYIEVKGYETDRDRAKWEQSDKKVLVIKQKDIDRIRKNEYNLTEELKILGV
jgi:hypothetical protein